MRYAVYAPLLFSLLIALPAVLPGVAAALRTLPDRLDPRPVLVALTASMAALALATTASLALLVVAGTTELLLPGPLVSPEHADPGALPGGVVAAVLLGLGAVRTVRVVGARSSRCRRLRDAVPDAGRSSAGVPVFVEDDEVFAVATPPRRGVPGRVVVSRGLWAALDDEERAAVLAHEQEHLDRAHHRHLAVAALAIALNPLLAPWWHDVVYSAERCADEGAARRVDDRRVVARAVGRAALSARSAPARRTGPRGPFRDPAPALGVATGPVPRRVSALLAGRDRGGAPGAHLAAALLAAAVLVTLVALAGVGAAHAAWDLRELLGAVILA